MNYKVLYRKYRPINFEEIIGQDYIIKTLQNSIINNTISHAYIFSGPRGCGKTSTARVFAKAINCLEPINGSPCGKCNSCVNFSESPDIIEIDAASNNGVDEIRNLIDNVKLTPNNSKYKVYIIDEVHMLTTSAFNALLLTLEEPPHHVIFILATTNIESVPVTILSRCQRFDFKKIKVDVIVKKLEEICKLEKLKYENEALEEIAFLSEGGMRDALSLLDQLSANKTKITLELIENQIKIVTTSKLNELIDFIEVNDGESIIKTLEEYSERNVDYKILIKKLIEITGLNAKNIKTRGQKRRLDFISYKELTLELADILNHLNINVNPYTILELTLLKYIDYKVSLKKEEPEIEDKKQEEDIKENKISNSQNYSNISDEFIDIRINNCFVNAKKSYLEEDKKKLENAMNNSKFSGQIKAILLDSTMVTSSDTHIIFSCINEHVADNANKIIEKIEKKLAESGDISKKIIFISNEKWEIEKTNYIKNLKNKIKYKYIEEAKTKEEEIKINEVFNSSKVEIV